MNINNTPVFVGTSGYNYEDWKGTFAPADTDSYDLLPHYISTGLNFLELTYTFYRMPLAEKIAGISDRLGENTKISLRLNKALMRKKPDKMLIDEFKEGIKPVVENGKLVALFADFHQQFTAGRENFDILKELRDSFNEVPIFMELHNSTWHKERFYEEFKANDIGLCVVDTPNIRGLAPYYPICSNNNAYFRLYGKSKKWLTVGERALDYTYSTDELKKFIEDALSVSVLSKKIFFSFCNVENGNAPKNAVELMNLVKD